jgi:2-oxoisovalerate dehydrogenase E1 component beta subunit
MPIKNNIEALRDTMAEEMRRDPCIIITGEDVGPRGGVFRATEGLYAEFGPNRVIDSPLSELSIVGIGIGMALNGLRPICEIQFADFIHPAFNQLVNEAAKIRYRSNGAYHVPMVIRAPYGGGISGGLYHSQSIEAIFAHTPGLYVVAPSTPYDIKGLLRASLVAEDPVLFLEHKKAYRLIKGEIPDEDYMVPIGVAEVKRAGDDLTIISYGLMMHESLKAADALASEGVSVELSTCAPLLPSIRRRFWSRPRRRGRS